MVFTRTGQMEGHMSTYVGTNGQHENMMPSDTAAQLDLLDK